VQGARGGRAMLQGASRLLKQVVGHGPRAPSVLAPDEIPHDDRDKAVCRSSAKEGIS
jgi:hypothetical protein